MINQKNALKSLLFYLSGIAVILILVNSPALLLKMTAESVGWLAVCFALLAWVGYEM